MLSSTAKIDLHSHSTRSDGKGSPEQVVTEAVAAGLDVIALTDHDTTSGWAEGSETAKRLGIGFIAGIEVTTRASVINDEGEGQRFSVHMLAYLPDPKNVELQSELTDSSESRRVRLKKITERLSEDYDIDWDAVEVELASGKTAGRPAVADAMIKRGIIKAREEFFEFVFPGSKYYEPNRGVPETYEAIRLIRRAGGVPVIAHPMARGNGPTPGQPMPVAHFESMIEAGLGGFEAYHRDVPEHVTQWLEKMAFEHDLVLTGSSDYHGTGKPNRLGERLTSAANLEKIISQATGFAAQL